MSDTRGANGDMSAPQEGEDVTSSQTDAVSRISKLFDIRLVVGGLLVIYGLILLIKGLFDSDAEIRKGAGLHLNLWTGIGMLVVGLLMLAWMKWRPLAPLKPDELVEETGPRTSRATGD